MMNRSSSSSAWKRLTRSNSLILGSELAVSGSEFGRVTSFPYQRLSQSKWLSSDEHGEYKPIISTRKLAGWTYLGKVFSFKRMGGRGQVVAEAATKLPEVEVEVLAQVVKKKKRSSWLPDPDRRWPVQGW